MSDQPPSAASFVTKEFDEFKNTTTITHVSKLECNISNGTVNTYEFSLRQVKTKDVTAMLLDCQIKAKDWFRACDGKIIFNCDQENHEIEYHESNTDVQYIGETCYCFEFGFYQLSQDILKQLCEAKQLKTRLSGDHAYEQPDEKWCAEFQKYCRQYYNNVFDSSVYSDALAGGPKANSGCFVATAVMGSYDDPVVCVLRQFRDLILVQTALGRKCVGFYYSASPSIASWLRGKPWASTTVKWAFVLPASMSAKLMLRIKRCLRH